MEAKYEVRGDVLVVELKGRLDFETTGPFRKTFSERLISEKVVFDLKNLSFVGSLGLQEFVDAVDHIAKRSDRGVKLCSVGSEFRRLFEASIQPSLEIYENKERALESWSPSVGIGVSGGGHIVGGGNGSGTGS